MQMPAGTGVIDLLEKDPINYDQRWVLISTLFPVAMVEKKERFYVEEYFKKVCEQLKIEKEKAEELLGKYQTFKEENLAALDAKFNEQNQNATSVFGLKIRQTFATQEEANKKAASLQRTDPDVNIFLGEVGAWLPLCSDLEYHVKNQEFLEPQLNELMRGYKENQQLKDEYFEERKRTQVAEAVKQAREAREKRAAETEKEIPTTHTPAQPQPQPAQSETQEPSSVHEEQAPIVDKEQGNIVQMLDKEDPWMQRKSEEQNKDSAK